MHNLSAMVGTAALLFSSLASATVITDTVSQFEKVGWWDSYSYSHVLNEAGESPFTLGSATSASLDISIADDREKWYEVGGELITFIVEDFDFDTGSVEWSWSAPDFSGDLEINALAALNSDGKLDVTIKSLWGDFYVGDSILTVTTEDVPEPATLALLSAGLIGVGVASRKSRKA